MDFTFLKNGGVAFYRSDAEQADWTEEQMSLLCTFPVDEKKTIERGMTVLFKDPATGTWQAYEIRNCQTFFAEGYQQFTAEDIAISELTDCHIPDRIELTNVSPKTALNRILSGTGWTVGTDESSGTSSGDIERGSVWQGVTTIRNNWNVNILTRVEIDKNGITGRYLDIVKTGGTWRGLLLAIDKNSSDPCLTYDDSELYTALYAYGASYTEGDTPETQTTIETNISGISWAKTSAHPAKPSGQNYLEWPEKTALYGRNKKPRFGYYQNSNIKDPNILIQKTWETLKICSEPKVSITGTVMDLKRFGYNDVPLRLYDMAVFDFGDFQLYKQIIALTVNLLDPTGNTPTIGDYIPNIIYINREVEEYATGGSTGTRSGRGGGGGGSRSQKKQGEFETSILQNERNIILEARQVDENRKKLKAAGIEIDPITGVVIYAEDVKNGLGSVFKVQSNKIESEVTARKNEDSNLSSRITQTADQISLEVSERKNADSNLSSRITITAREIRQEVTDTENRLSARITVNADNISLKVNKNGVISAINQTAESVTIRANRIDLSGYVTASELSTVEGQIISLTSGSATVTWLKAYSMSAASHFSCLGHSVSYWSVKTTNGITINVLGYLG